MIKYTKCEKCKDWKYTEEHHVDRRRNTNRTVRLCRECHRWVHSNITQAKQLGLYTEIDSIYRPKKKDPKKWKINKGLQFTEIYGKK